MEVILPGIDARHMRNPESKNNTHLNEGRHATLLWYLLRVWLLHLTGGRHSYIHYKT